MTALDRRVAGFARLYAPMLLIGAILTFIPYYEDADASSFRTLWEIIAFAPGGGIAFLAATVLVLGFLAWGVFGPRSVAAPIGIAVTSAVMLVVMLTRIGAPDDAVHSDAGQAVIVMAVAGIALGIVHTIVAAASRDLR